MRCAVRRGGVAALAARRADRARAACQRALPGMAAAAHGARAAQPRTAAGGGSHSGVVRRRAGQRGGVLSPRRSRRCACHLTRSEPAARERGKSPPSKLRSRRTSPDAGSETEIVLHGSHSSALHLAAAAGPAEPLATPRPRLPRSRAPWPSHYLSVLKRPAAASWQVAGARTFQRCAGRWHEHLVEPEGGNRRAHLAGASDSADAHRGLAVPDDGLGDDPDQGACDEYAQRERRRRTAGADLPGRAFYPATSFTPLSSPGRGSSLVLMLVLGLAALTMRCL